MADQTHPLRQWQPWSPPEVAALFASLPARWIAGGWAIDLFLGQQTREHEDIDVQAALSPPRDEAWPFRPWHQGEVLDLTIHDVWCRRTPTEAWALQLMIADTREDWWLFRRMPTIARALAEVGGVTAEGIPYLAPEIGLLYKAKGRRPKDEADFIHTLPALGEERRHWLKHALTTVHPQQPKGLFLV